MVELKDSTKKSMTGSVNGANKNSIVKTFLRKTGIFAITFLLANLFLLNHSIGQIIQVAGSPQSATMHGSSVTITKPSGIAVGDVMIAQINQTGNGNTISDATSSGWIVMTGGDIYSSGGNPKYRCRATILYKIAVAGDLTTSNYTFAFDADTDDGEGAILGFSGVNGPFDVTPGALYANIANDNTYNASTISTATPNAAVIMFGASFYNSNSISGWTTTNPGTLSELYDLYYNAPGYGMGIGAAWASKSGTGATGTGTATLSVAAPNGAILIALRPAPILAVTGTTNHGSSCIGTAASPITYTINNTGSAASGITVISNSSQFVASNLSSTTIAAGGSATYKVTFTPNSSGAQSATITVASTTSESNSATSSLTGTGNANNTVGSPSSSPAICINTGLNPVITIATTGATGITSDGVSGANGLPAGLSAHWASNIITISGTPTTSNIFNYSIPLSGGCGNINAPGTITVNPLPVSSVPNQTNISCFGAADGTITVSGSGGTSPYTFSINNGINYFPATGTNLRQFIGLLPNTAYQIKIKDNKGCISN